MLPFASWGYTGYIGCDMFCTGALLIVVLGVILLYK
jgi:hypothetical protein